MASSAITFQLVFSDGSSGNAKELMWEFYCIALAPFAFGIPPNQVQLFLAQRLLHFDDGVIDNASQAVNQSSLSGKVPYLPIGYADYFKQVYTAARTIDTETDFPSCAVRIITGHGFGGHDGGHILCGKITVPFSSIKPVATHLTILDICNSVYAVASFTGNFPEPKKFTGNFPEPKKFTGKYRKKVVITDKPLLPVACDCNSLTLAFRIGVEDHHEKSLFDLDSDVPAMSLPIGDSVTACLLAAVAEYSQQQEKQNSLDELFVLKYKSLSTVYLNEDHGLKPYSDLSKFQGLLDIQALQQNSAVLECEMFRRQKEWFLTFERATALSPEQDALAKEIVDFVIEWVRAWHHENRNSTRELPEARASWIRIVRMMGPFALKLKNNYLEQKDNGGEVVISTEEDGVEIEMWAASCETLGRCLKSVSLKIHTDSFSSQHNQD